MRTNGFALFRGPEGRSRAEKAVRRLERYCAEVVSGPGVELGIGEGSVDVCFVAYALEGSPGLPLVHGFADCDTGRVDAATGEFAVLGREAGSLFAARDLMGTRPLYSDEEGSCIASDHRFFQGGPRLLPNGARLDLGSMKVANSGIAAAGSWSSIDECAEELSRLLTQSVKRRVGGRKKVAVSFSGGLDSSLIALIAAKEAEVVLCSAYTAGSRDEEHARRAAKALGLELVATELDRASAARELDVMDLPFEPTTMDKALWCIYSTTAREAARQDAELIMLGQLADELFGGYMKYARAAIESEEAAARMMYADIVASGQRAFVRDEEAVARFAEVRLPFADERLVALALGTPVSYKISGGERKSVLRRAALQQGLPEELAATPKKAAQYSSGVAKLVS